MLINKDFVCHDIQVTVALPESYDFKKAYPVVFLNDGQLEYLGKSQILLSWLGLNLRIAWMILRLGRLRL